VGAFAFFFVICGVCIISPERIILTYPESRLQTGGLDQKGQSFTSEMASKGLWAGSREVFLLGNFLNRWAT